ncbi:MAG: hypothetical protein U5L45_21165 [Saprospiraceae bacterium]|nr:hypothetical protein [Saprospiraceae bacterium]
MAQHLTVALKATLVVSKKRVFNDRIPPELAIETVENNFDLSCYTYSETEHFHLWKLNQDMLDAEIIPFIESVLTFYYDKEEAHYQGLIGAIKRNKSYESLFKLAKDAEYDHFEMDSTPYSQFQLKHLGKHLQVDFNFIRLFTSERLRIDNFDKTFKFLSNCMQKTFSAFQLSKVLELYFFDTKRLKAS